MCGDENNGDLDLAMIQFLLEFGPAHSRHGNVEDQALALRDSVPRKELLSRRECLRRQTEHLEEIWQRSAPLRFTRDRTVDELWGYCAKCYYRETCLAGCSWTTHVLFGRRGNNPFCHHRALELLREGRRERIVRTEAAAGMPIDFGKYEIVEEGWPDGELERAHAVASGVASHLVDAGGT